MKTDFKKKCVQGYIQLAWCFVPLFMAFLLKLAPFQGEDTEKIVLFGASIALTGVFSLYVWKKKLLGDNLFFYLFPVILFMSVFLRIFLFPYASDDFVNHLHPWMQKMNFVGWPYQIVIPITNYNLLYTYILAGLTYIPFPDLYLIKFVSVIFDCVLGVTVLTILKNQFRLKDFGNILGFTLAMIIPSLFLNSGAWGQCDSLWVSLVLIGIYLCLQGTPYRGCIFLGLAFSAKLQAVFLFPILLFFFLYQKVYLRHLFMIPLTYMVTILPAFLLGRSFQSIISIYSDQIRTYPELTKGAPSFWALFPNSFYEQLLPATLCMAAIIFFIFTLACLVKKIKDNVDFWDIVFMYALIIPYFLPKMHERYFYPAVVLTVIYFFRYPKLWLLLAGIILIDLVAYMPFLFGKSIIGIEWLSLIYFGIILYLILFFFKEENIGDFPENFSETTRAKKGLWYFFEKFWCVFVILSLIGAVRILKMPANGGDFFKAPKALYSRFSSEKIKAEHPVWKEELIKLSDKKIIRPSVSDVADIVVHNDHELVLRWNGDNEERFIKVKGGDSYIFKE